jgi:hypothetical protein
LALEIKETKELATLREFLERVPNEDPGFLAKQLADDGTLKVDNKAEEMVARFKCGSLTFRVIHALDLDVNDKKSFNETTRAKKSVHSTRDILGQGDMPIPVQQKLMAILLVERATELVPLIEKEAAKESSKPNDHRNSTFAALRSQAQEKYWLDMSAADRARFREDVTKPEQGPAFTLALSTVKANWHKKWDNGRLDRDHFRNYLTDQTAAKKVWELLEDDVLVVLDRNLNVVAAKCREFGDPAVRERGPRPARSSHRSLVFLRSATPPRDSPSRR